MIQKKNEQVYCRSGFLSGKLVGHKDDVEGSQYSIRDSDNFGKK